MERKTSSSFLLCFLFSLLVSDCMCRRSLEEFSDQKTYYSPPDPHHSSSSHRHHGHRKSPSCGSTTPSHSTPSHGGGGYSGTPDPSHGSTTPSHGGGGYSGTPPSHGSGGGYYNSPPTSGYTPSPPIISTTPPSPLNNPVISTPPSPIIDPGTTPTTPPSPIIDPGTTPTTPSTPTISTPPPTISDPNSPPYFPAPCSYWITHPAAIWSLLGYWGTVGGFLGAGSSLAYGKELTLHQALSNTRTDGIGELYRQGTAALLNSMATNKFPFTSQQVKDAFTAALGSQKAAADQAEIFKLANEGKLKKH